MLTITDAYPATLQYDERAALVRILKRRFHPIDTIVRRIRTALIVCVRERDMSIFLSIVRRLKADEAH
jgi:hypothetical protein